MRRSVVAGSAVAGSVVAGSAVTGSAVTGSAVRAAASGALAVLAARASYAGLRRFPPAGGKTWTRTNHRGELVTLLEGPAVAVAAVTAQAVVSRRRADVAAAVAGLGALGFGLLDDLRGSGQRRGLRGHLGALAQGEVTTGAVKLAGLAATGVAAALAEGGSAVDVTVNAGLVAGGANLLNLFDLRPGRAIKVAVLAAGLTAAGSAVAPARDASGGGRAGRLAGLGAVAAPAGAALALAPEDLGERAMLGDAGANALGALLGAAVARALPRPARVGALAVVVTLTLASEKVSFTKVIERTPALHKLDMLGRRPAPLAAPVAAITSDGKDEGEDTAPRLVRAWWGRRPGRHRRNARTEP